ncbi:hypothetical protein CMO90_00090 [Candidatus Woesearchaeota archaeon]|nr:hypothetical protein [Candidatus Woesearchaeota archaeon]
MKKKLYTCFGDNGCTSTLSGDCVAKDDCLIDVNGDIDSLQASIDKIVAFSMNNSDLSEDFNLLEKIQVLLWQLGGEISQRSAGGVVNKPVKESDISLLEDAIASFDLDVKGFQRFSNLLAIEVNESRVRTRKLERSLTNYLRDEKLRSVSYKFVNRLSAYFFALAVKIEKENFKIL